MSEKVGAYSDETDTHYEDWDALVAAEANGYVVTAILTDGRRSWPWSVGPFATKREGTNARARLRNRIKRDWERNGHANQPGLAFTTTVRPLWKDDR